MEKTVSAKSEEITGVVPWIFQVKKFIARSFKPFFKILKRRKFLTYTLVSVILLTWSWGFLIGWLWSKGRVSSFPEISRDTRLLVVAPHPDDEVLIAGGLMQRVLSQGGNVRVVYLTIGDHSIGGVIKMDRRPNLTPGEFLDLGEERRNEAVKAMNAIGVKEDSLVFFGFPDGGLQEVLLRDLSDERGAVVSQSTKLDHVPYRWAYKPDQPYFNDDLTADMKAVINDFRPNLVVTTHSRDLHPDHRAAFELLDKLRTESGENWPIYGGLVHFRDYPAKSDYIYPPKKLFNDNWVSLGLMDNEKTAKKNSLNSYYSQLNYIDRGWFMRFGVQNEIWEKE